MPRTPITTERQAKDQTERAVEMLAEVRRYVWDEHVKRLPKDPAAPVPRRDAEIYCHMRGWFEHIDAAIHLLDPGADNMLMPSTDAERAAIQEVIRTGQLVPPKPVPK